MPTLRKGLLRDPERGDCGFRSNGETFSKEPEGQSLQVLFGLLALRAFERVERSQKKPGGLVMKLDPDARIVPGTKVRHTVSGKFFVFDRKGNMGENIFIQEDGVPIEIPAANFYKYEVVNEAKQEGFDL